MHLVVLYPLDANTYQYGEHIVNMERKQMKCGYPKYSTIRETKKTKHNFSYKTTIWRTFYIKVSKNAERIVGV
jgi:hypothetical protein